MIATLTEFKPASLRKHFALGYYLAATLAPLIYGVGPQ